MVSHRFLLAIGYCCILFIRTCRQAWRHGGGGGGGGGRGALPRGVLGTW